MDDVFRTVVLASAPPDVPPASDTALPPARAGGGGCNEALSLDNHGVGGGGHGEDP